MSSFGSQPVLLIQPAQQQTPAPQLDNIVTPPRFHAARYLLEHFNEKTERRIVCATGTDGTSSTIETFDGEKLTPQEERVYHAACDVLEQYLMGKLQPDAWETPVQKRIESRNEKKPGEDAERVVVHVVECPSCHGANVHCNLCGGEGKMVLMRPGDVG